MSEVDIDEPLEQAVQHGMALSAQVGRELARAWRDHLEQKARSDEKTAALVQQAFNKEREVAAVTLAPVQTPEWWDEATVPEILNAYEISNAWAEHEPRAAQAEETLRLATAERYGFDPAKLLQEGHQFTEHLKNTDPARLAEAQRWARVSQWEGPPSFYPEAQKIRTLLRDYDQAVAADLRNSAKAEGIPVAEVEQKASVTELASVIQEPALKSGLDQQARETAAWAWLRKTDPARAKEGDALWGSWMEGDEVTSHQKFTNQIVSEWEAAQEAASVTLEGAETRQGDALAEDARQQLAAAEQDKDRAARLSREAEQPAQSDLDQARAWALQNDPEYASKVASEQERFDRELVDRWKGSGDPDKAAQAADVRQDAKQREAAGDKAAAKAGAAYDRAAQLEADAARMRAAGAPEKAVAAKQFGEAQQKFPISHAAAGGGKAVGKVKANPVQQSRAQGKHMTQGR
ncbi:hypothetical protein [Arthrobacter sp. GAS37]|uniref:hypothetical protein n=1 Tax=Arthrobacter sp. GAS37 TaxID=3156261 RepID=UPI00384F2B0B